MRRGPEVVEAEAATFLLRSVALGALSPRRFERQQQFLRAVTATMVVLLPLAASSPDEAALVKLPPTLRRLPLLQLRLHPGSGSRGGAAPEKPRPPESLLPPLLLLPLPRPLRHRAGSPLARGVRARARPLLRRRRL